MTNKMPESELNALVDKYLSSTIEAETTSDPVDAQGNLVDQNVNPLPINPNIIMALNAQDAHDMRMANLAARGESTFSLLTRYAPYVDKDLFKNPRSVFTGPRHMWHFCWLEDYEKDRDHVRPLSDASQQQLEMFVFRGYRPADFRALAPMFVSGNDAALLAVNRRPNVVQALGAKKVPPPPMLPTHLWDKFGMLMPPTVNQRDGTLWIGRFRLYMIERAIIEQGKMENRRIANGDLHQQGGNIKREDGSMQGRFEIDLDSFMANGGRI